MRLRMRLSGIKTFNGGSMRKKLRAQSQNMFGIRKNKLNNKS